MTREKLEIVDDFPHAYLVYSNPSMALRVDVARICDSAQAHQIGEQIIACFDACAGIPTDKLRPGILKELRDAAQQLMRLHPSSSVAPRPPQRREGPVVAIEEGMRALLRELGEP